MLVDSNHAKACFSSLRDHPAGVQNAFAFSDSQHLNVLLGPSGRPLCVQNAFAFCQPLGHLTVNCYRFLFSILNRSTACSLIRTMLKHASRLCETTLRASKMHSHLVTLNT